MQRLQARCWHGKLGIRGIGNETTPGKDRLVWMNAKRWPPKLAVSTIACLPRPTPGAFRCPTSGMRPTSHSCRRPCDPPNEVSPPLTRAAGKRLQARNGTSTTDKSLEHAWLQAQIHICVHGWRLKNSNQGRPRASEGAAALQRGQQRGDDSEPAGSSVSTAAAIRPAGQRMAPCCPHPTHKSAQKAARRDGEEDQSTVRGNRDVGWWTSERRTGWTGVWLGVKLADCGLHNVGDSISLRRRQYTKLSATRKPGVVNDWELRLPARAIQSTEGPCLLSYMTQWERRMAGSSLQARQHAWQHIT